VAAPERLDQPVTLQRPGLVEHDHLDVRDVPTDRVAEEHDQQERQQERERETARVAPELDALLAGHGEEAPRVHPPGTPPARRTSATKTSSRDGSMRSIASTRMPRSSRRRRASCRARSSSSTMAWTVRPKSETSITPGRSS